MAHPQAIALDKDAEALEAIEDIVAEMGIAVVVRACLASSLGDALNKLGSGDTSMRIIQVLIRQIAHSENPMLEAEIMALGSGVILADKTGCRRIATKWGMTPAAVSKRVIAFADAYRLPPSQYMRSLKDRQTYSETNRPRTK